MIDALEVTFTMAVIVAVLIAIDLLKEKRMRLMEGER